MISVAVLSHVLVLAEGKHPGQVSRGPEARRVERFNGPHILGIKDRFCCFTFGGLGGFSVSPLQQILPAVQVEAEQKSWHHDGLGRTPG